MKTQSLKILEYSRGISDIGTFPEDLGRNLDIILYSKKFLGRFAISRYVLQRSYRKIGYHIALSEYL